MSATIKPKCPECGSYFLSSIDSEGKKRCIDCAFEFETVKKSKDINASSVK
jgi:DNA-directed RNA polymerase subunit RPC12/RpoP